MFYIYKVHLILLHIVSLALYKKQNNIGQLGESVALIRVLPYCLKYKTNGKRKTLGSELKVLGYYLQ